MSNLPIIEISRNHLKWTIVAAIASTILFVIASLNPALNNLAPWAFGVLNATRFIMLGCFVALVVGLVAFRLSTPQSISCVRDGKFLQVSPCDVRNVWIIDRETMSLPFPTILEHAPTKDHRRIQVLVLRSCQVPEGFVKVLLSFKNLTVLDVQGSSVPGSFWSELEACRSLHHILAHGVLSESDMKEIHMTLPEAKFYLDRCQAFIQPGSAEA